MELFLVFSVLQVVFWVVVILAIIYLVFKRIEDKKREDFEDREN